MNLFNTKIQILLFGSLILFYSQVFAEENENRAAGTHSAIVEADGYAFLAEDKTMRELREEALANAKRDALEKGKTYIKSFTKVENYELKYDLVQSQSEGFVKILESRDLGITTDNRYHYWIKAEIEYQLKVPETQGNSDLQSNSAAPLTVTVWTEKPVYLAGEKIKIFLRGNKDFYGRVLYMNVNKEILQLLPNQLRQDNFFEGGKVISLPEAVDGFQLEVGPPFGREQIVVYASSAPQGPLETAPLGESLYQVNSDLEATGKRARIVQIPASSNSPASGTEFFEASCEVETVRQ